MFRFLCGCQGFGTCAIVGCEHFGCGVASKCLVEPGGVPPVILGKRGELDLSQTSPWLRIDEFDFIETVDALSRRVVAGIPYTPR